MRKLINVFKDNILFFIEIIILVVAFMIPKIIDANNLFSKFISTNDPTPENVWYYLIIQRSNVIIGIGLCLVAWYKIRKYNKDNEVTMNRDISIYHQHFFFWYWFVSKVMGVKKCKLIKVPIFMQVKLVIHNVFDVFLVNDDYPEEANETITIKKRNFQNGHNPDVINLVLVDTYPIEFSQLPHPQSTLPTITISRNTGEYYRCYSPEFLKKVISEVRELHEIKQVNVFATLNPKHSVRITEDVFAVKDRGNITHLYIYQQDSKGKRVFETKGRKIF